MCEYCDETKEKYLSLRRDDIYGKEFIAVRKLGPCKMDPDRNKWITSAYVNGGNPSSEIHRKPVLKNRLFYCNFSNFIFVHFLSFSIIF